MMEVIARSDGRFAVCESEGSAVDPVVAIFPTAAERLFENASVIGVGWSGEM